MQAGTAPTLAGGRYLLLEPSHTVALPRFAEAVFAFVIAGYVPVITHPERLAWIRAHYAVFRSLVQSGVWMQVTAGSLCGRFGNDAQHVALKMLDDGLVHVLATDAHDTGHRAPLLAEGRRPPKDGWVRTRRSVSWSSVRRRSSTIVRPRRWRRFPRWAMELPSGAASSRG